MSSVAAFPSRQRCAFCRGPISVHQEASGGVCAKPTCKREALLRNLRLRNEAAAAELRRIVQQHHAQVTRALGIDPEQLAFVRVPAHQYHAVKLPGRRKRQFQQRLWRLIREIFAASNSAAFAPPDLAQPEDFAPEPPIFQAGCATCRGHCCRLGAPLAFLDAPTIGRFKASLPRLGARDVLRAYLKYVPEKSTQYSCVYHGEKGCTLPRQMRAHICNEYHCDGLRALDSKQKEPGARSILIIAAIEGKVFRSAVYNRDLKSVTQTNL